MRLTHLLAATLALPLFAQPPVRYDSGTVSGIPARNIGSATMSGRIAAVAAVNDSGRLTVFAGSASGGVWKSVNGGTTFKPVFDSANALSIGALAIDPTNSKIVWAGTGESWVRNSVSIGDGVYKSTDGGENWNNVGLIDTERIAKILVDPKDGNTVWTCATGHLGLSGKVAAVAGRLADEVVVPAATRCCGMAGDRGWLHPELPAAALADTAAELEGRAFDACLSSNRTCEIALQQVTGRPYESLVLTLEALTRS